MSIDFEEEANEQQLRAPSNEELEEIATLASRQVALEKTIAAQEQHLKDLNAQLFKVRTEELPSAMARANLKEFALRDGTAVKVKKETYASISKANEAIAFRWLDEHNHGSIIKRQYTIALSRENEDAAKTIVEFLNNLGMEYSSKSAVAPQTLKAFVREELERGSDIPRETFGIFQQDIATVTLPNTRAR